MADSKPEPEDPVLAHNRRMLSMQPAPGWLKRATELAIKDTNSLHDFLGLPHISNESELYD